MNPELLFVLGVLTTWRLSRDYVNEEGPLGLYGWSRRWLMGFAERRIDASGVNDPREHGLYWLYAGVECVICVSFWVALWMAALLYPLLAQAGIGGLTLGALWWWGLAGGALVVERVVQALKGRADGAG